MANDFAYLYPYSFPEAKKHGELPKYEGSFYINVDCARDIEQAIRGYSIDGRIQEGCAKAILDQYGFRRVNFVLATSVKALKEPSVIHENARMWCGKTQVFSDPYSHYFAVKVPTPLLESFIVQTQQEYQSLGLFGPKHCVGNRHEMEYAGKVLVLSPDTLREGCWTPENQLWYAHDGFGCSPNAIGRSIRATCLGDGEMTRWDRSEFTGVLDERYLPDWAAEKLKELRSPVSDLLEPSTGSMTMQ